jgi:hypothetical protein
MCPVIPLDDLMTLCPTPSSRSEPSADSVPHDATTTGQRYLRYRRAKLMLRFEGAYLAVTVALWHRHLER